VTSGKFRLAAVVLNQTSSILAINGLAVFYLMSDKQVQAESSGLLPL
jgi:hypothetical protein